MDSTLSIKKMVIPVLIISVSFISIVRAQTCQIGEYFNVGKQICFPCTKCVFGQHEVKTCNETEDRQCEDCPKNTYYNGRSCINCSRCINGEIRPCNVSSDALCLKESTTKEGSKVAVALTLTFVSCAVALAISLVAVYLFKRKRRQKPSKETPEEVPMNGVE